MKTLEERLLEKSFAVPVYVTLKSPTVTEILASIDTQGKSENGSALNGMFQPFWIFWFNFLVLAMFSAVVANGYQLVNGNQASSVTSEVPTYNIIVSTLIYFFYRSETQSFLFQGKLAAYDRSDRVSSIAIVAHYDSFGLAPVSLAFPRK